MSLDDVRAAIDRIDDQIVALLCAAPGEVEAAATFKADDAAVRAPDRRAALLARVRDRATRRGAPDVVAATFTAMVDAFIALELGERRTRGNPA